MTTKRRVTIFPSDAGYHIRFNAVRWRKYLCYRLEAAGITYTVPTGALEPLPTGNYRWSRYHDGTITIEQQPCQNENLLTSSENYETPPTPAATSTASNAHLKKPAKSFSQKGKRSRKRKS